MSGTLWGIGLGPGDPELVTVKAARLIGAADVVAFHSARHGRSISRGIAEPYMRPGQIEEHLVYPVTTETTDHPGGYQGAIDEFYEQAAARLAAHLAAGRDVALLAAGDPLFYSSYMHMHRRLADRFRAEIVPGITSVSAASAALGTPLVEGEQVLTVLPGTMPVDELTARLRETDAAAIMKLGRTFPGVRQALADAGRLDDAYYVERASSTRQRVLAAADVDEADVPYFSITLVPGPTPTTGVASLVGAKHRGAPTYTSEAATVAGQRTTAAAADTQVPTLGSPLLATPSTAEGTEHHDALALRTETSPRVESVSAAGEVVVVGLGPGAADWTTPEVTAALDEATDLVGYTTYIDRVPERAGQRRHASDNKVESERAAMALDLAKRGARVAVVSSGDPGVFAMAAAVLEVSAEPQFKDVPVRVLPGLTAANAVASRVGAPLGHDYAMISLSDRLKPWEVVAQRLSAVAAADMAIAIYNPASSQRRWQVGAMREILLVHRDPETPVVLGRDVGGPTESVRVVTLAELNPDEVDMRTLLIIGASTTTAFDTPEGTRVFTARRYEHA
ncbi:precorrin-3B C(17)-methyltransferase [Nocardia caishijiensis]|uniref:Precorrin-3 methyltransferase /precorrin-2 C20-methyltransferase /cobalt-factor II C20-methyltransferase n=1 Tax=Nocardia caishijiensis TaxID=184756 RepID=A0ABQ6YMW5_9NOCA|nr:precorrin-3B C(17)-methyltransferase [Nocardia caishijiensis]KAF0847142.1 precorrin-3 methyltransferase /precorrin-2 C20-methyltransferase /cobalt-factor II C20-methyltransferase [Nocardia caishijiensis]